MKTNKDKYMVNCSECDIRFKQHPHRRYPKPWCKRCKEKKAGGIMKRKTDDLEFWVAPKEWKEIEALKKQIEALKKQNKELKKRKQVNNDRIY